MKLFPFIIITIGLMFTFYMAGIDTGSSKVIDAFQLNENETLVDVNPNVTASDVGSFASIKNQMSSTNIFYVVLVFFFIVTILSLAKFSVLSASWSPSIDAAFSVLAGILWALFAIDIFSIIKFVGEITGNTGWVYQLIRIILVVYLVGFLFALISFIKKGE